MSIFSCKDTVRLLSDSLDGDLSLGRRLAMRVHLLGCPMCSRFRRQLLFLHDAARQFEENESDRADTLSAEARERIRRALEPENP